MASFQMELDGRLQPRERCRDSSGLGRGARKLIRCFVDARIARPAPETSHEPQIGPGLLLAELAQRLLPVSSPDQKRIGCKGFPETVTRRPSRASTAASDKATHVAQNALLR